MREALIGIAVIISASVIIGFAYWIAGANGMILGAVVFIAVAIWFMSYLGLFNIQPLFRKLLYWAVVVAVVLLFAIWIADSSIKQVAVVNQLQSVQNPLALVMAAEEPIKVYKLKDIPNEGVDVYKNASVAVILPLGVWAQTDPDVDVAVWFPDAGKLVIDGPNKNPVYGDSAEYKIFRVRAIERDGKLKLTSQIKGRKVKV